MLFWSFLLIIVYGFTVFSLRGRQIVVGPFWMPHGDAEQPASRQNIIRIVWGLPAVIGLALAFSETQRDVGTALLSVLSFVLIGGLLFGLCEYIATVTAPAPPPPEEAKLSPQNALRLVEAAGSHAPFGARPVTPGLNGLHFSSLPANPGEIVHYVPRPMAEQILSEIETSRKKVEETVSANITLRAQSEEQKTRIAHLEKSLQETEQALAEMNRLNQALRSKSVTAEKPFAQMTVAELEKAREARDREIRTLDELKRTRALTQQSL